MGEAVLQAPTGQRPKRVLICGGPMPVEHVLRVLRKIEHKYPGFTVVFTVDNAGLAAWNWAEIHNQPRDSWKSVEAAVRNTTIDGAVVFSGSGPECVDVLKNAGVKVWKICNADIQRHTCNE